MRLAAIVAISVAALCVGCGGQSAEERSEARSEQLETLRPTLQVGCRRKLTHRGRDAKTSSATSLMSSRSWTRGWTSVSQSPDYSSNVSDVKVEYDRIEVASLTPAKCVSAALAGEQALRSYLAAYTIWDNCFDSDYCTNDSIMSELQSKWLQASAKAEKAEGLFASVGKAGVIGNIGFPRSVGQVDDTIYGTIATAICATPDPPAAQEPCAELRNLLAGGVDSDEEGDVDDQIDALVDSLGLNPNASAPYLGLTPPATPQARRATHRRTLGHRMHASRSCRRSAGGGCQITPYVERVLLTVRIAQPTLRPCDVGLVGFMSWPHSPPPLRY